MPEFVEFTLMCWEYGFIASDECDDEIDAYYNNLAEREAEKRDEEAWLRMSMFDMEAIDEETQRVW